VRGALFTAWLASLGLITWEAVRQYKRPPLPGEVAATVVVFGTLSLFEGDAAPVAALFGWGVVVAGVLRIVPQIGTIPDPCSSTNTGQAPTAPASGGKTS
jgi:hypothetical protein